MADDQVVKLLEEIRDLQKENLANQKLALENQHMALKNQQQSLAVQGRAVQRSKILYVFVAGLFVFLGLTYVLPLFSWVLSLLLRR